MLKLIQGDCISEMKKLIEEGIQVDMVLVDPPYGTTSCDWDILLNIEEMWDCIDKITHDNSAILIFSTEPQASRLRCSNLKLYRYDLYWVKEKPTNFFQVKKRFGKSTENICVFYKKQPKYFPQMRVHEGPLVSNSTSKTHTSVVSGKSNKTITPYKDNGLRYPNDVLYFNRVPLRQYEHPTQKPIELLKHLIRSFTEEGDLVLDFTMGSGSTGVACKELNRSFVGIEMDETYYNISSRRMSN